MTRIEPKLASVVPMQAPIDVAVVAAPALALVEMPAVAIAMDALERGTLRAPEQSLPPKVGSEFPALVELAAQIENGVSPPDSTPLAPAAAVAEHLLQDTPPSMPTLLKGLSRFLGTDNPALAKVEKALAAGAATATLPALVTPPLSQKTIEAVAAFTASPRRGSVQIPGPLVVAMERDMLAASGFDLSQMDVESAVIVVMSQLSSEADADLRDMLKTIDAGRRKRDALRQELAALKQRQAHEPPDSAAVGSDAVAGQGPHIDPVATTDAPSPTQPSTSAAAGAGPVATPEQVKLSEKYGLSPKQVADMQLIYDVLPTDLGNPTPSFEVFLTDASWLQQVMPDVVISAVPGQSNSEFVASLFLLIKREILNPTRFQSHVEAAYKQALATDFFLHAEHGREDEKAQLQSVHDTQLATLERLKGAGAELFGTDFVRDFAEAQVAIASQFREEAEELMRGGSHHGDEIGTGFLHGVKESFHEHPGLTIVAAVGAVATAAAGVVTGGVAVAGVLGAVYAGSAAAGGLVLASVLGDRSEMGSLQDSDLACAFVAGAAQAGLSDRAVNDMLHIGIRDEDDAEAFLRSQQASVEAELREANALSPDEGSAAAVLAQLAGPRGYRQVQARVSTKELGAHAEGVSSAETLPLEPIVADDVGASLADQIAAKSDELDSQTDLSDQMQLRLQLYMERKTKVASTLSNILKKLSDTKDTMVGNIK